MSVRKIDGILSLSRWSNIRDGPEGSIPSIFRTDIESLGQRFLRHVSSGESVLNLILTVLGKKIEERLANPLL